MRIEMKVALIGLFGTLLAALIALFPRLIPPNEPLTSLDIIEAKSFYYRSSSEDTVIPEIGVAGMSGLTIFDLTIRNNSESETLVNGVKFLVDNYEVLPSYDACAVCARFLTDIQYSVSLEPEGSSIRDLLVLEPGEIENIQIVFGGEHGENYVAQLRAEVSWNDGQTTVSEPAFVIVFSNDDGSLINGSGFFSVDYQSAGLVELTASNAIEAVTTPPGFTTPNITAPNWLSGSEW